MEFSNVVVFSKSDSSQIAGTVTNKDGNFLISGIKTGSYYVRISFIGFDEKFFNSVDINSNTKIDLGKIYLDAKSVKVNEVVVSGSRSPITYEIDKKIISVGDNLTSLSGTAVDVLENVPSIDVDVEGNVSLRGSGNFTVLIDGRPSALDASEALQQIPATAIENIEIITNPSAKYNPEGTAGIINIIMKKSDRLGISGIANINAGLNDKYGGEMMGELKVNSFQGNLGFDYNNRNFLHNDRERNWTNTGSETTYYNSDGTSTRGREFFGLRSSIIYNFDESNSISIGGRYGNRSNKENSNLNYYQWTNAEPSQSNYISRTAQSRSGGFVNAFTNYKHEFGLKGHELIAETYFRNRNSDEVSTNRLFNNLDIVDGKITTESGPESEYRSKLDYTLPLGADTKFEAGYQGEIETSTDVTSLSDYDPTTQSFVKESKFSNNTDYITGQLAIYSLYSNKIDNLGFQAGVRTEYTGRKIDLASTNNEFKINRWDFFPSIHSSYDIAEGHQLMGSYTRRINRPRGWQLEPFETWEDAYNVRMGNPGLLPEYIDSYEFGYQTTIGNTVMSLEGYYRVTHNKIERVQSAYSENVTLQSFQNIGQDYSLGTETFFNFDPIGGWNVNLMGNLYSYKIVGNLNGEPLDRNSFNWNIRFNNDFKLTPTTEIQFNLRYNSPTVSSQGRREGRFSTNFAVKREFFDKLVTAVFQLRNLFGAKFESTTQSPDFYNYRYTLLESPVVMLNLRLNLNNYKDNNPNNGDNSGNEEGGLN